MSSIAESAAHNLDEVHEVTYEFTYESEFLSMQAKHNEIVTLLNFDPECQTKKFLTRFILLKSMKLYNLLLARDR